MTTSQDTSFWQTTSILKGIFSAHSVTAQKLIVTGGAENLFKPSRQASEYMDKFVYKYLQARVCRIKPNKYNRLIDTHLPNLGDNKYLVAKIELCSSTRIEYQQSIVLSSGQKIESLLRKKDIWNVNSSFKSFGQNDLYNEMQKQKLLKAQKN